MAGKTIIKQGLTNHVAIVLDRSYSMFPHREAAIRAIDTQIAQLAKLSQEMDQETRVTIVIFDHEVDVLVYDKGVLRLPSIARYYEPRGRTALIDATLQALDDLSKVPELYADHAFMVVCLTDGAENASSHRPSQLSSRVAALRDNWSVAALVPDALGEAYAQRCGFPPGNILTWDASSASGFQAAAESIQRATRNFMQGRATGVRGSQSLFSTKAESLNAQTISAAGLKPMPEDGYLITVVSPESVVSWPMIRDWVPGATGHAFRAGMVYQELVKPTEIQGNKVILVVDNSTGQAYGGTQDQVRSLLGLDANNVKVKPQPNKAFSLFVQSTSSNRKPVAGQRMLLKI